MSEIADQTLPPNQPGLTPLKLIQTYSPEDWESFIGEWAEGFNPPYTQIVRLGGAGDMGRDIIGHIADFKIRPSPCDVYQCKHYNHPLRPTEAYPELGKLCVHTFNGNYPIPRQYRFVSPRHVGPDLYNLINYPSKLRASLIVNWDKYCASSITASATIPLTGKLKAYVESFDFSIVGFLTPTEIISQHQRTRHFHTRFKVAPPVRPEPPKTPDDIQTNELKYITCLLEAYADHLKRPIKLQDLASFPQFAKHFAQARGDFFSAEALGRFSRDNFTPGAFEKIKKHLYDGVVDVTLMSHADGLACLLAVMTQAASVSLPNSELLPYVWPTDRKGMCHHLSNDGELNWTKKQ